MKKLIGFVFVGFLILTLFYVRDFSYDDKTVNYVYDNEYGLYTSVVDDGSSKCSYIELDSNEISRFLQKYDVKIVDKYYIDDMLVYNAYSKYFDKYLYLNDNKYNLQIAFSQKVLVGYPQLYLGF